MFKMYVKGCESMTKTGRPSWAPHYSISNSEASSSHFRKHCCDLLSLCSFFPTTNCHQVLESFCHHQSHPPHQAHQSGWGLWRQVFVHHNLTQCWFLGATPKCSGLKGKKLRKCFSTIRSLSISAQSRHRSLLKWNGLKQMSFGCQTITLTC